MNKNETIKLKPGEWAPHETSFKGLYNDNIEIFVFFPLSPKDKNMISDGGVTLNNAENMGLEDEPLFKKILTSICKQYDVYIESGDVTIEYTEQNKYQKKYDIITAIIEINTIIQYFEVFRKDRDEY